MTHPFLESEVEAAALDWFAGLGWTVANGLEIAPGEVAAERMGFEEVTLNTRLRAAIARLNPAIPGDAQDEAFRKVIRLTAPSLTETNRAFHRMLVDGVEVEYRRADGSIAGDHVKLIDFANADENDWLAVNQFTVIEKPHNRRPDIVFFGNYSGRQRIVMRKAGMQENIFLYSCILYRYFGAVACASHAHARGY